MKYLLIAAVVLAASACVAGVSPVRALAVETGAESKAASAFRVTQPTERAVFQRNGHGVAEVPVAVAITDEQADTVEVR